MKDELKDEFQEFVADPRLSRVIEVLKRSNDVFNIIDPVENQHSDILKWLFDPREGHGQGDAIFKDFMTAAYENSHGNMFTNKDFFAEWTPSRIARTGFHSLISIREYSLSNGGRLDLLMIDTANKILIVVENKRKARLGNEQLIGYFNEVKALRRRPALHGYQTAHIVLDRNYDSVADKENYRKPPRNRWTFVNYQWLEAGAHRADLQFKRGNQSAGLVIAYCQKQSDYVPPEEREIDDTLADVARDYRLVVSALGKALDTDVVELTRGNLQGLANELWIFANHHPELVSRLQSKAELSFIESRLRTSFPNRKFVMAYGKNRFWVFDENWSCFSDSDAEWPVCVSGREMTKEANKYIIYIQYRPSNLSEERKARVHEALEKEFPELKKWRQSASYRTLGRVKGITESTLVTKVQEIYKRLESALAPLVTEN